MGNKKFAEKLIRDTVALTNAVEDPFVRDAIRRFNYTPEQMLVGRGLYNDADRSYHRYMEAVGQRAGAWDAFTKQFRQGRKKHSFYRKLARMILKGDVALKSSLGLGPGEEVKQSLGDWLEQARQFYTNGLDNEKISKAFSGFGVKARELKAALKHLDEVKTAAALHKQKKTAAREALVERDNAFKLFDAWMKDFWVVCRLALAGHPAQMTKLKLR
ncbi:MAG: hypothetical protein GY940_05400 [bacterium]|nr:hypothetical protein [bacterium]